MMIRLRWEIGFLLLAIFASRGNYAQAEEDRAALLAKKIDEHLAARFAREKIVVVPPADDAEFLRRAYLDLTGRIPRPADVHEFLADKSPTKREELIESLLADPRHAIHQAKVWTAVLLPEVTTGQAGLFQRGFENWLVQKFRAKVRYDELVRELITVPLPSHLEQPEAVLRDPERPNPLAFIAAKNAKPEALAAAVTRMFLGVRLECAQCHNHPFADWTQEQFWNQAAFFGGLKKNSNGLFAAVNEDRTLRSAMDDVEKKTYVARFLTGAEPDWNSDERSPRAYLADWLVAAENPYFAKAGANRLWGQIFGVGLVEPVDDFHDNNLPSDPELLALLANEYAAAGFDMQFLTRAICRTQAYQRTSARTDPSQEKTTLPAKMIAKALSGEQFVDSVMLATGYRDEQDKGRARGQFLSRFALVSSPSEPQTSVQQALTLSNGSFVDWATDPQRNPTLIAVIQTPGLSQSVRIEALFLTTLGRSPSAEEVNQLRPLLHRSHASVEEGYADIFWILLNSAEFRLNH